MIVAKRLSKRGQQAREKQIQTPDHRNDLDVYGNIVHPFNPSGIYWHNDQPKNWEDEQSFQLHHDIESRVQSESNYCPSFSGTEEFLRIQDF